MMITIGLNPDLLIIYTQSAFIMLFSWAITFNLLADYLLIVNDH